MVIDKPVPITKAFWNALPVKDKRQHKDGSKAVRIKNAKPGQPGWQRVVWLN